MRYQRHRRTSIAVPVVSMGDIAFLLTIFFMVCSNFSKEAGIKFAPAVSPDIASVKESRISVIIDSEGILYLQGREVEASSLQGLLERLLAGRTGDEARAVVFKCDRAADRTIFAPAMEAIAGAGGIIMAIGDAPPGESEGWR